MHKQAIELNLPPEQVLSVIEAKRAFDRYAVSRVGSQGLMQVIPFSKDKIGRGDDNLTHSPTNLRYGCHILRFYLDQKDQNLNRALAAYNGPSGILRYPHKARAAWGNRWRNAPFDW